MAPVGSVVTYLVSKGTELAVVPDVTGKSESDATSQLKKAGFKVSTSSEYSDSVKSGRVSSQNPSGGGSYPKGSTVTIIISNGPNTVKVPDVIGQLESDAKKAISDAGLKATVKYELHTSSGAVIDQDPKKPTEVKLGSTVTITVDGNPPP
jgi:eukaryotic-like serine/threonine-protein kinase